MELLRAIFLLSLSITNITARLKFTIDNNSSLSQCLNELATRFFAGNETIWILKQQQHNNFEDQFLKSVMKHNGSILNTFTGIARLRKKNNFWKTTDAYIIETTDEKNFDDILTNLKYLHSWNSQAKFVVITGVTNETETVFAGIIKSLWLEGVLDFILISSNNKIVNFHTWYPHECRKQDNYANYQLLDTCSYGKFTYNYDLFPVKIPKEFTFCQLMVGAVLWPPYVMNPTKRVENTNEYQIDDGLEVRLIKTLAEKLGTNVTFVLSEKALNWGYLLDNGTATGLMASLREKKIDIAISAFTPTKERLKYFEVSRSYFYESYSWCVPHASTQPSWRKLLDAMSFQMWICFFGTFLIYNTLVWLLSKSRNEPEFKNYSDCLITSLSIALGVSAIKRPRTSIIRLVTVTWIFFCFNFSLLYETRLMSDLTKPIYQNQINSIEGILERKFKIRILNSIYNYLMENATFLDQEVSKISIDCTDMRECFDEVAEKRDAALCLSSTYTAYVKKSYITKDNIPLIYCFESNIATYPVLFLMKRGFPLKSRLNYITSQLVEGGFVDFWAGSIFWDKWKQDETAKSNSSNSNKEFLDMDKLKSAFVCLFTGWILAAAIFVLEIIVFLCKLLKGKQIFIV